MIGLVQKALEQGLVVNERLAAAAINGFDWMFRRDNLVLSGQTDYELIHEGDLMSVRYYCLQGEREIQLADGSTQPVARRKHPIPLVLVPPLGVTTEVFDLMPNRSLVRYMAARGFKTYLICWGNPQRRHAHLGMKDYADTMMQEALDAVRAHSGEQEVSLMGWCMGGLLSLMHAGMDTTTSVRNIITVASPIDPQGGGIVAGAAQALNKTAQVVRKFSSFRIAGLDPAKLHAPGWVTALAFKLTDPVGSVTTYWDLLTRLWDREFVENYSTTSDYLNNMLSYPAGMIKDMAATMVTDYKPGRGVMLGKKHTRMGNITAPMLVFAGERDALVSIETARGSLEAVSSTDKRFEVAPGGHMGVMLGGTAQRVVWAKSADWLDSRSGAAKAKPAAKVKAAIKATSAAKTKAVAPAKAVVTRKRKASPAVAA